MSNSSAKVVDIEKYRNINNDGQGFTENDRKILLEIEASLKKDDRVEQLEAENMKYQHKLQNCIPVGSICFLVSFACVMVACVVVYILQLIFNSKLIDFYILTFIFFAALVLLRTTIKSIKEWRKFLSNGH